MNAIGELPAQTPVAKRPQTEASMIEAARSFGPVPLARIGRRLAEIIDPDGVQAPTSNPSQTRDRRPPRTGPHPAPNSSGAGGTLRAKLDAVGCATLFASLNAVTTPGATPNTEGIAPAVGDGRTLGQRCCDGLVEAVRQTLGAGGLPSAGGVKPRVVVTIPYSCLKGRTGAGRLADGTLISPSLTRQLADDAEIVPVWLSPTGIPLDVGRTQRPFAGRARSAASAEPGM